MKPTGSIMSCSSTKARQARQAACTIIILLLALVLAASVGNMAASSHAVSAADEIGQSRVAEGQEKLAPVSRGFFAATGEQGQSRRYHPGLEASNAAGALGFWLLASICGLLLGAAVAPAALQRLRSRF